MIFRGCGFLEWYFELSCFGHGNHCAWARNIGWVNTVSSLVGEVEEKVERLGRIGLEGDGIRFCVVRGVDGNWSFRDFYENLEILSRDGAISDDHLTPVNPVHDEFVNVFLHLYRGVLIVVIVPVIWVEESLGNENVDFDVSLPFFNLLCEHEKVSTHSNFNSFSFKRIINVVRALKRNSHKR